MKQILEAGVEPHYDDRKVGEIRISNLSAFILLFTALGFSVISFFAAKEIFLVPVIGVFLCISIPVLNSFKLFGAARFLIAVLPSFISAAFNILLTQKGEPLYAGMIAIGISFTIQPFIIYKIDEVKTLILALTLNVIALSTTGYFSQLFHVKLDSSFFGVRWVEIMSIIFACINAFAQLFILLKMIYNEEKKNQKLVKKFKKVIKKNEKDQKIQKEQQNKLEDYLKEIEVRNEEDKKRNWKAEGLAKFSNMLRSSDQSIDELFDDIIAELSRYLGAIQGGIYIEEQEGEKKFLELVACFAYERKKYLNSKIELEEGLVGMCFLEQEPTYLKKVPEDYVRITSGLGDANPRRLLLIPIKSSEQIVGVIELASFNEFEEYQIEFLLQLGEVFAGSILSLKIQERTNKLLEESQSNTEALRAQEEEMRQNMEEMQATQEEFYRKEKEYLRIIEELKASNN